MSTYQGWVEAGVSGMSRNYDAVEDEIDENLINEFFEGPVFGVPPAHPINPVNPVQPVWPARNELHLREFRPAAVNVGDSQHTVADVDLPVIDAAAEFIEGSDTGFFGCEWGECNEVFTDKTMFVEHVSEVHTKQSRYHCCEWRSCDRQEPFLSKHDLSLHVRRHTGERPNVCCFPGCGKTYTRLENLKTHLRTHTGERPFRCKFADCDKKFTNASDCAKHQTRTHSDSKPYQCCIDGCDKAYTDPSSLRKHVRRHHGDEAYEDLKRNRAASHRRGRPMRAVENTRSLNGRSSAGRVVQMPPMFGNPLDNAGQYHPGHSRRVMQPPVFPPNPQLMYDAPGGSGYGQVQPSRQPVQMASALAPAPPPVPVHVPVEMGVGPAQVQMGMVQAQMQMPGPSVTMQMPGPSVTMQMPGPSATVEMPGSSATIEMRGPSATMQIPGPSATIQMRGPSATMQIPGPSATMQIPGPSATMQIRGRSTTMQIPGRPAPMHLAGGPVPMQMVVAAAPMHIAGPAAPIHLAGGPAPMQMIVAAAPMHMAGPSAPIHFAEAPAPMEMAMPCLPVADEVPQIAAQEQQRSLDQMQWYRAPNPSCRYGSGSDYMHEPYPDEYRVQQYNCNGGLDFQYY